MEKSTLIPVSCLNDCCPITLTSPIMKYLKKLIKSHILNQLQHLLDPFQFAYQLARGVEDNSNFVKLAIQRSGQTQV